MTELVACLSTGKGTWVDVIKLMKSENWQKIFLISNQFGKDNFKADEKTELIVLDDRKSTDLLAQDLISSLKDKLVGPEIAVNLVSGSGKEHMALITALLKMGYGIRLVHVLNEKVEEL